MLNWAFLCRTRLFCVEPCILLLNRFFVSHERYNANSYRIGPGFTEGVAPTGQRQPARLIAWSSFGWFRTLPWIRCCHPYWPMRYGRILGHKCQYLIYWCTYEQHSITCVQEIHGSRNIYYIGLTTWTTNVVWLNPKAPIPKFDSSS